MKPTHLADPRPGRETKTLCGIKRVHCVPQQELTCTSCNMNLAWLLNGGSSACGALPRDWAEKTAKAASVTAKGPPSRGFRAVLGLRGLEPVKTRTFQTKAALEEHLRYLASPDVIDDPMLEDADPMLLMAIGGLRGERTKIVIEEVRG